MKDKAFAKSVSRDDMIEGAKDLDIPLDELIELVVEALKPVANKLGLAG